MREEFYGEEVIKKIYIPPIWYEKCEWVEPGAEEYQLTIDKVKKNLHLREEETKNLIVINYYYLKGKLTVQQVFRKDKTIPIAVIYSDTRARLIVLLKNAMSNLKNGIRGINHNTMEPQVRNDLNETMRKLKIMEKMMGKFFKKEII